MISRIVQQIIYQWQLARDIPACLTPRALQLTAEDQGILERVLFALESNTPGAGSNLLLKGQIDGSSYQLLHSYFEFSLNAQLSEKRTEEESGLLVRLIKTCTGQEPLDTPVSQGQFKISRTPHCIRPEDITRRILADDWVAAFDRQMKDEHLELSAKARFGRLLFALGALNGVVSAAQMVQAAEAVQRPILCSGDFAYLVIVLPDPNQKTHSIRNVILTAATRMLAIRDGDALLKDKRPQANASPNSPLSQRDVWQCIKDFFKTLDLASGQQPKKFHSFLAACSSQLKLTVPIYAARYASGHNPSTSLSDSDFRRLLGFGPRREFGHVSAGGPWNSDITKYQAKLATISFERANTLGLNIRERLKSVDDAGLRARFGKLTSQPLDSKDPPSLAFVWTWGRALIENPDMGREGARRSTCIEALESVGAYFCMMMGRRQVSDLDSHDLSILQNEMIYLISLQSGRSLKFRWLALLMAHLKDSVPSDHEFQVKLVSVPEAACYTPSHIERAMTLLMDPAGYLANPTAGKIYAGAVAGWTSGQRTSECTGLLRQNIDEQELRVKATPVQRLKTASSPRRHPLRLSIIAARTLFQDLLAHSTPTTASDDRNRVFLSSGSSQSRISDAEINAFITPALKQATGSSNARPYHLRHCFINYLFLSLASEEHDLASLPARLPTLAEIFEEKSAWRNILLEPSRTKVSMLRILGRTMGHATPARTLTNYIHTMCLVMHALLEQRHFRPSPMVLYAASGLPKRTAIRHRKVSNDALLRAVEARHPQRVLRDDTPLNTQTSGGEQDSLYRRLLALHGHMMGAPGIDESGPNSDSTQWSQVDIQNALKRAKILSQLKTSKAGSQALRHRMTRLDSGALVPPLPTRRTARNSARVACAFFESALAECPDDLNWAVHQFVNAAQSSHARVSFSTKPEAIRFLNLMARKGDAMIWGQGICPIKKDIRTASIKPDQNIWVAYVPNSENRRNHNASGWTWAWQMMACSLGS